jgi:hypothetical protein
MLSTLQQAERQYWACPEHMNWSGMGCSSQQRTIQCSRKSTGSQVSVWVNVAAVLCEVPLEPS